MLILTRSDVERLLPIEDCIDAMDRAMRAASSGDALLPLRQAMPVPQSGGKLVLMPGWLGGERPLFDVKIVSKFPRAAGSAHGTHVGAVMLFNARDGLPMALIEGGALTAIRTAATSALATRTLSRPDSAVLTVLGAGEQARNHVRAIRAVRPIARVIVWARDGERARGFVDSLDCPAEAASDARTAVHAADVICTTTSATDPVLLGAWVRPGAHINLVGSAIITAAEADADCVAQARYYVDYRPAALAEAGELKRAIDQGRVGEDHIVGEIGEVLLGRAPGRRTVEEITLYKSLGIAAQDLAAADALVLAAQAANGGLAIDLSA